MRIKLFIIFFLSICISVQAQPKRIKVKKDVPKKKYEFSIAYESKGGSNYFDLNSTIKTGFLDTIPFKIKSKPTDTIGTKDTTFYTKYIFSIKQHSFIPELKVNIDDDWSVTGQARLTYSSLNTTHALDSLAEYYAIDKKRKLDLSMFKFEYFKISSEYALLNGPVRILAFGDLTIPGGFHNGLYTDTASYKFLSDGALQGTLGTKLTVIGETYKASILAGYNMRGEEFSNRMILGSQIILNNVPGTELSIGATYFKSLNSWDKVRPFSIKETTAQEDLLAVNVGFSIYLDESIYTSFNYELLGWGKNAWSYGIANLKIGYAFN